jgi:hypothetical protein
MAPSPNSVFGKLISESQPDQLADSPIFINSVNTVGSHHFVNVTLFNSTEKIKLMIDTGSKINIINQKFVPKSAKIFTNDLRVVAYNGSSVNITGFVETDLIIDGANWGCVRFYVVSDGFTSILGTAAIEQLELDLCLTRKKLIQAGPIRRLASISKIDIKNPNSFEGRLAETMTFKAKSEVLVDLLVADIYDTCPLFFESDCFGNSKLEAIPSFQYVTKTRPIFTVLIINPSEMPIKIEKNTKIVQLY